MTISPVSRPAAEVSPPLITPPPVTRSSSTVSPPSAIQEASPTATETATVQSYGAADFNPVQAPINTTATTNFYVNGVRTPENKAEEARQVVAQNLGEDVELLYNPTEGFTQGWC